MPLTNLNISVAENISSNIATTNTVATNGTASTLLLAANSSRKGASIYNSSPAPVIVDYLPIQADPSPFAVKLAPEAYYEVPFAYVGAIYGATSAGNIGNIYVREFV